MPTVVLPSSLLHRSGGLRSIEVEGATVREVLSALETRHPELAGWILDEHQRIRRHVNVFVDGRKANLETTTSAPQEIFVIQAITGGKNMPSELLVGTKKGLFVLRGERGGPMEVVGRHFAGETIDYAMRDRRSGYYFAATTHGQFGPHLYRTLRPEQDWEEVESPAFPSDIDVAVERVWVLEAGTTEGVIWAGVAPAALFRSDDNGRTWQIVRSLWDHPSRPEWEGGLGGLALHSICPWPGDPSRLTVAMSAVGVWQTGDGGASWTRHSQGLVPRYLPEEAHDDTIMHCVHKLEQALSEPETFYMQFHGGVYRSDDSARAWREIGNVGQPGGLPADFGFPIVVDPRNADRAFVIPLVADVDRVTVDGRVRVYETADRGGTWSARTRGLPQENAYLTVLRQGFCHDGGKPLGFYFGTESGTVFGSSDDGATWSLVAEHLPPITSVRVSE